MALLIWQSFPRTQTSYCRSWRDTPDDTETQRGAVFWGDRVQQIAIVSQATRPNVDGNGVLALQREEHKGSSLWRRIQGL